MPNLVTLKANCPQVNSVCEMTAVIFTRRLNVCPKESLIAYNYMGVMVTL